MSRISPDSRVLGAEAEPIPVAFERDDVTIRGDQWRTSGQRGHIIFLHGGGQTRHSWDEAARRIAATGWTCTTLDLRGHGDSDWSPDGRYGVNLHVADLKRAIEEVVQDGPPVLVGASLGGLTALSLASAHPHLARAIVLVDIVPRPNRDGVKRIQAFMTRHLDGFASLEEVGDAVAAYNPRRRHRNLDGLRKNVRLHEDGRWYWHWDPRMVTHRPPEPKPSGEPPAYLPSPHDGIEPPLLIVRGALSDVVDDDGLLELRELIPTATVAEVPGAGHMVAGDDNDLFIAAVTDFIDVLPTDSPGQRGKPRT
ncbi:alpha/beta fold hydrolase [Nocardioides sp.]|uniref:alpha/beta fold hydrolase n=1 Tax=Nocardioides sp. TaxID=35761 RepID=UPI002733FC43|nr:alpha/beta hydrolase [Nocardioides sp.]MDP3892738.1 alpha/beta hydrolase [Nocardioides sp.]